MDKKCETCKFEKESPVYEPCLSCIESEGLDFYEYEHKEYEFEPPTHYLHKGGVRKMFNRFCDSIKDYEHESKNLTGFDERESVEFVKIFLEKEANNG